MGGPAHHSLVFADFCVLALFAALHFFPQKSPLLRASI